MPKLRSAAAFLLLCLGAASASAAPAAPAVTAAALAVSAVQWTWTLSAGATGYRVLSSTGGGNISGDLSASATAFALPGLSTNTRTTVTIEAFGPGGAGDTVSSVYSAAAQPTGTAGLGTRGAAFALEWNTNGNPPPATGYDVSWSTAFGQAGILFSTTAVAGSSASAAVSGLPTAQTLYFMVRARNGDGVATPFDAIISTFIPALFGQPAVSSGSYALGISSIAWSWTASTGAVSYQLFSSTGGPVSPVLPSTQFVYNQTGLATNTTYADYVQAFDSVTSTNSAAFVRATLAAPTAGLALTSLSTAAATAQLSWGANGNPAYTQYDVLWWSNVTGTQTVAVSTPALTVSVPGLPAGGTIYFTAQSFNADGLSGGFDPSLYAVAPSTYFPVGSQGLGANGSGLQTFLMPAGVVSLLVSSNTFAGPVTLTVQVPGSLPLPNPAPVSPAVNLQISALDAFGAPQQPASAVSISYAFANGSLGALDIGSLAIARFDTVHQLWLPLATFKNRGTNTLTALTDHLSLFAVMSVTPPADLLSVSAGPNPLRPTLVPGAVMTFRNLPPGATVRIFDYTGEQLAGIQADASGITAWDGRNRAGNPVASGVYLAVINGGGAKKILRVAVER